MEGFQSVAQLVEEAENRKCSISEAVLHQQSAQLGVDPCILKEKMRNRLSVMQASVCKGLDPNLRSSSGLSGGNAFLLQQAYLDGKLAANQTYAGMMIRAMAVAEYNAAMGRIVASPTAGSCGILPGVLLTLMETQNIPEEKVVMGLFNAAGTGMIIARNAYVAGAQGGCQAECGTAAAMAASAAVELLGGTPRMCAHACAMAIKAVLGLVCDPVAGLVEVPCIKRNVSGAVNAITTANLALAGIESVIPADDVIGAMKQVGDRMCSTLKETALGGLAATPAAEAIAARLRQENRQDGPVLAGFDV